jgi:hypothetical protein
MLQLRIGKTSIRIQPSLMLRSCYTIIQQPTADCQSQTGHSYTQTHTIVFTQIYFIQTYSTAKQWLQKSVTPQGAPFFNLVLASAIHHMNIYVTIRAVKTLI